MPSTDNKYKKSELTLIKNPVKALALAIIKQWQLDGRPKGDAAAIEIWKKIAEEADDRH